MSSSILLRGFPLWNSSLSMGMWILSFVVVVCVRVGLGCHRRGI